MSTDDADSDGVTLDRATWRAAIDRADGDPPDPVSVADVLADAELAPGADLAAAQRAVYAALDGDGPLEDVDAGAYGGVALADTPGDGRASGTCGPRERDDDVPSADDPEGTADAPDPDGAPAAERGDVDAGDVRAPALEAFADARFPMPELASDARLTSRGSSGASFKSGATLTRSKRHRQHRDATTEVTPEGVDPCNHPLLPPGRSSNYRTGHVLAVGVCGYIPHTTMHDTTEPRRGYR